MGTACPAVIVGWALRAHAVIGGGKIIAPDIEADNHHGSGQIIAHDIEADNHHRVGTQLFSTET